MSCVNVFPVLKLCSNSYIPSPDWIVVSLLTQKERGVFGSLPNEIIRPILTEGLPSNESVRRAALTVAYYLQNGNRVVIRCHDGTERSALIGAIVYGMITDSDAITSIRRIRKLYGSDVINSNTQINQIKRILH